MPLFGSKPTSPLEFSVGENDTFNVIMSDKQPAQPVTNNVVYKITITNTTRDSFMWKMKLSNFDLFSIQPYQGIIENGGKTVICVTLLKNIKEINFQDQKKTNTKFLCEYSIWKSKMGPFEDAWKAKRYGEGDKNDKIPPTKSEQSTTTSTTTSTTPTQSPLPDNFYSYRFLGRVVPPENIPTNYAQFLEQKIANQKKQIESLAWLLAENVEKIRKLEDNNSRLEATVRRYESGHMERQMEREELRNDKRREKIEYGFAQNEKVLKQIQNEHFEENKNGDNLEQSVENFEPNSLVNNNNNNNNIGTATSSKDATKLDQGTAKRMKLLSKLAPSNGDNNNNNNNEYSEKISTIERDLL